MRAVSYWGFVSKMIHRCNHRVIVAWAVKISRYSRAQCIKQQMGSC